MVPNELNAQTRIAMTTRNTGSPSEKTSLRGDEKIQNLTEEDMRKFRPRSSGPIECIYEQVSPQNEILVMPLIIQRKDGPYYQQLTRDALLDKTEGFGRIDLQILKAVDNIRMIFANQGIQIPKEMDLLGQSAAGTFAQRFCFLHLDRANSCCTNGSKDGMILPVAEIDGTDLPYPNGISDIEQLTGKEFDIEAARKIEMIMTYGALEDEVPHINIDKSMGSNYDKVHLIGLITPRNESEIFEKTMGTTQAERMLNTLKIYRKMGLNLSFLGFIDYGHGQGKGSYEAAEHIVAVANNKNDRQEADFRQEQSMAELKSKYKIVDLVDVIGNENREKDFINISEMVTSIRNMSYDLDEYRLDTYGRDNSLHSEDPKVQAQWENMDFLEKEYKSSFEKFIDDIEKNKGNNDKTDTEELKYTDRGEKSIQELVQESLKGIPDLTILDEIEQEQEREQRAINSQKEDQRDL